MTIPFDDHIQLVAELSIDSGKSSSSDPMNLKKQMSINAKSIHKISSTPLKDKILYKIIAYLNGAYVDERTMVHGQEAAMIPFALGGGKTYSFVAYSINSMTELPEVVTKAHLSTARVTDVSGDLLWVKKDVLIKTGDNSLSIALKHMFSQITVIISTGSYGGQVKAVGKTFFEPSRLSASLNLSTGILAYNQHNTTKNVEFPSDIMNQTTVTSNPVLLISPSTTVGKFSISHLNINGLSMPLLLEELKIAAGKKYNLRLTVNTPCTEEVFVENFCLSNGQTKTFSPDQSGYGYYFDFFSLDNSFRLTINGKSLLQRNYWEIQREEISFNNWTWVIKDHQIEPCDLEFVQDHFTKPPLIQNLQFKSDKKRWGIKTNNVVDIPEIYDEKGDKDHPIFRLQILPSGAIKMYGTRTDYGPLEEVEFIPVRTSICQTTTHCTQYLSERNPTVVWNQIGTNAIVVSQVVSGSTTHMTGRAYGRNRIPCSLVPTRSIL